MDKRKKKHEKIQWRQGEERQREEGKRDRKVAIFMKQTETVTEGEEGKNTKAGR